MTGEELKKWLEEKAIKDQRAREGVRRSVIEEFARGVEARRLAFELRMQAAREQAVRAWQMPTTENITFDPVLASIFAEILVAHMYAPHLGCATTGELLDELRARAEVDGSLGYSTVPQL